MADIETIRIGTTDYTLVDSVARENSVRMLFNSYATLSSEYNASTAVYHFLVNPSSGPANSRLFCNFSAGITRTANLDNWTAIWMAGWYRNSGNTANDGAIDQFYIAAPGKNPSVTGPTDYDLTCTDFLDTSKSKWLYYMCANSKFKVRYHSFNLYVFNNPSGSTNNLITTQSGWVTA